MNIKNEILTIKSPKVLIINSQNIYKANATGITMRSLWKEFSPNDILEIYQYKSVNSIEDNEIKFKSIQIPPKTKFFNYYIRQLLRLDNYFDTYDSNIIKITSNFNSNKNSCFFLKRAISLIIKAILENEPINKNKKFLKIIDEFKPDVIYSMGSSFFVHSWVLYFSKRYDIPIVMHYMDDWRTTVYMDNKYTRWLNKIMMLQLKKIENKMRCGLTISEDMANVYKEKYKKEYRAIMNTVSFKPVKNYKHLKYQIVYAGGLHLNRYKSLLEIANIVSLKEDMKLIIYTSKQNITCYQQMFTKDCVEFREAVPHEKITKVYEEADVLLHIESFEQQNIEYTRYSLSTKIPEYMLSGKPIICFAPSQIAVYKYIKENRIGFCIDKAEAILDAISFYKKDNNIKEYTDRAVKLAQQNHSLEHSLNILIKTLKM